MDESDVSILLNDLKFYNLPLAWVTNGDISLHSHHHRGPNATIEGDL